MEHWLATYAGLVLQQANLPQPHSLLSNHAPIHFDLSALATGNIGVLQ